jgi:hypothetical protein
MKGPYERLKYDLRRVWECPVCSHKERTSGAVATRLCGCQEKMPLPEQRWMRLVEDGVRRVGHPPTIFPTSLTATSPTPTPEPATPTPPPES